MIRHARNGRNVDISFLKRKVYNETKKWDKGISKDILGNKLDKEAHIRENITDEVYFNEVNKMLVDWELYENGWFVATYNNTHLFNYKCQLGNNTRPKALNYLKN